MTKLKLNQPIMGLDNRPLKDEKQAVLELGEVIGQILVLNEEGMSAEKKYQAFKIAIAMAGKDEIELDTEDAAFVLERVGKYGSPVLYGRLKQIMDPPKEPKEPKAKK